MYFWVIDIATGEVVFEYTDMLEAATTATLHNEGLSDPDDPGWAVLSSSKSRAERMEEVNESSI